MNTQRTRAALLRLGTVAMVSVLVLGGCGGDTDEPSDSAPAPEETTSATDPTPAEETSGTVVPDLCGLFTAADFESLTGEPAGPPESQAPTGAIRGTCTINAEGGFPVVIIGAYNEADRETTLSMVEAEPVDDLGREAHWDDTIGLLVPLEGKDWYLQVAVMGSDDDRATSVQAAEIALERIE